MRLTIKEINTIKGKGVGEWYIEEVAQWDWKYVFELIHPERREIKTLTLQRESESKGFWNLSDETNKLVIKVRTDEIKNEFQMRYQMFKYITESQTGYVWSLK